MCLEGQNINFKVFDLTLTDPNKDVLHSMEITQITSLIYCLVLYKMD